MKNIKKFGKADMPTLHPIDFPYAARPFEQPPWTTLPKKKTNRFSVIAEDRPWIKASYKRFVFRQAWNIKVHATISQGSRREKRAL